MIAAKRLILPLVILMAVGAAWGFYHLRHQRELERTRYHALVTARLWVATATFRRTPEEYNAYRDSLLAEAGMTGVEVQDFLRRQSDQPEEYELFTRLVSWYVDSLTASAVHHTTRTTVSDTLVETATSTEEIDTIGDSTLRAGKADSLADSTADLEFEDTLSDSVD
jgi:hypothetical protein